MKKRLLICLLVGMIFTISIKSPIVVEATSSINIGNDQQVSTMQKKNVLRAVVIKKKFRYYHGKLQSRRWDETNGKWVDPEWIDV